MSLKTELVRFVCDEVQNSEDKNFFREPLIGFASVSDPLFLRLPEVVGTHHIQPRDILPSARTAMAFFIPFAPSIVSANRGLAVAREWAEAYLKTNALINSICGRAIAFLSEKKIEAGAVPATHNYDPETLLAPWSHRSVGFIAGLGRFGLNRMLITVKGCAGRYGSLVFAADVVPDKRNDEEFCTGLKTGQCRYCFDACPVGALKPDGLDRQKCNGRLLENSKVFTELGLCDVCGKCVVGPCAILAD
jgi:epoxyqueuosine reductase QueG